MSTRTGRVRPEVRELIALAESTPGWDVQTKVKRAEFKGPGGFVTHVSLQADDTDLRQAMNKFRRAGLIPADGGGREVSEVVSVRPIGSKPYEQMTVEERGYRVWMAARDYARAANAPEEMHDGALYYVIRDKCIADFIRATFPEVDKYESGPRPSDDGQRPIYDYLRAEQLIVRKGQQAKASDGQGVLVSDDSNPRAVKDSDRARRASERRSARPAKPTAAGPVSRSKLPTAAEQPPEVGSYIKNKGDGAAVWRVEGYESDSKVVRLRNITTRGVRTALVATVGAYETVEVRLPEVGMLLRAKPNGRKVFIVTEVHDLDASFKAKAIYVPSADADIQDEFTKSYGDLATFFVLTEEEYEAFRAADTEKERARLRKVMGLPEDAEIEIEHVTGRKKPEPEPEPAEVAGVAGVADPEPVAAVEHANNTLDEFLAALDLLRESAQRLVEPQGPDPVTEAALAEARREVAYQKAEADHQRMRAERAEETLTQIRRAVEHEAPNEAYQAIIKIVPAFPETDS